MKRLPGSILFTAAAIYLIIQGETNLLTLPAVLACAVCAVVALTRNHLWAVITGAGLISVSLILQISMNYWCDSCLKADMLLLSAVVCLAVIQRGKTRIPAWVMSGVICVLLFGVTIAVAPVGAGTPTLRAATGEESYVQHEEAGDGTVAQHITVEDSAPTNNTTVGDETPTQHAPISGATIQNPTVSNGTHAQHGEISEATLSLAKQKPALLFNPNCSPCREVVGELIEIDPVGEGWQAVQSGGRREEGQKYLLEKGYRGTDIFYQKQAGPVPALVVEQNGETVVLRGKQQILNRIKAMDYSG